MQDEFFRNVGEGGIIPSWVIRKDHVTDVTGTVSRMTRLHWEEEESK